jgi:Domain of unknown function (DUF4268)
MKVESLGRMKRIDLRDVFDSEAGDFTPWLAQEENLKLLGEALDLDLELEAQEKDVGPFRADLLCKDTATDNWVVIENQLERTNHSHLGQLLTYAAGLNAVTIVWIADHFAEDHIAALDWLNQRTDEEINFFGLEIELWKIGDSRIAPKFNLASKPNDWVRSVKSAAEGSTELSDRRQTRLRFWQAFRAFMESNNSSVRCQKPTPHHWMNHSIGRSGFHLASVASVSSDTGNGAGGPEIRVGLVLHGKDAREQFAALERNKDKIEKQLGFPLVWHNPEGKNMCRIYVGKEASFMDSDQWPEQHQWLKDKLETFHKVFAPLVKNLD